MSARPSSSYPIPPGFRMLLLAIAVAWPHGSTFGAAQIAVAPGDPDALWVLTEGWGLAHTTDAGGTWTWLCEEALGADELYGVVATSTSTALVATRGGLVAVSDGCGASLVVGTEGVFAPFAAPAGERAIVGFIGETDGAVAVCDAAGCDATDLRLPWLFPKSALADGATYWASTVEEGSLAAALWRSTDGGASWDGVYAWPDGDTDPRVLHADGDRVLVWRRTRAAEDSPELLRSTDGGATFAPVLEVGYYTDSTPGLLALDGTLLLGSSAGARTWRSEDDGVTWTEVSTEVPAVRCGVTVGRVGFACNDHLQDGIDVARTTDGRTWDPIACLEDALPADCAANACGSLLTSYQAAGTYGGGRCDEPIGPPADPPAGERCGCDDGGAALALLPLLWAGRRGRRGGSDHAYSPRSRYTSPP